MKYWKPAYLIALTLPFALTACTTLEEELPKYQRMSCTQLAVEIQRRENDLDNAKTDAVVGGIKSIFGDKEDRKEGDVDMAVAGLQSDNAKEYLAALKDIYRRHDCYR